MSTEPLPFLKQTLPALFNKGFSILKQKADAGDTRWKASYDDIAPVVGGAVVSVEGQGTVYLTVENGTMTAGDTKPAAPIKIAVEFPSDAMEVVLGEAAREGHFEDERVAIAAAHLASKQLETALMGKPMTCHILVKDAPDLGDVTVKLGFNVEEPPVKPGFTAQLKYDDLEDVREGKLNLQQLFMQGKLRMMGDYSLALQIAMQMAAKAQQQLAAAKK